MRSTFMGLEASKRGLFTQQSALYTTGHNISNANTEGYSRQRVNMSPTLGYPGIGLNAPKTPGYIGTGVQADSVQRIRDEFIDRQYRQETNKFGYWESRTKSISQMEDILTEPSEFGINQAFNLFWQALEDVSTNSENAASRQVAVSRAEYLAESFNYTDIQLKKIQSNLGNEISVGTSEINSILRQIAAINKQVQGVEPNGYIPNDLYDARDVLIDKLNEYFPVKVTRVPSGGNVNAIAEGTITISFEKAGGGLVDLVKGSQYVSLTTSGSNGKPIDESDLTNVFKQIDVSALGDPPTAPIAGFGDDKIAYTDFDVSKGKLLALIDSYGYDDNGTAKGYYNETIDKLDKLADTFVSVFNAVHSAGFTIDGTTKTGQLFFDTTKSGAAGMKVLDEVVNNPNLLAASSGLNEEGNGKWAIELANLQSKFIGNSGFTVALDGASVSYNGIHLDGANFQSFYHSMIGSLGVDGQEAQRLQNTSETLRLNVANNRASMSSVSLDEEMTNMITFQQAYNANARMITVIDETLDKIINGMGRVGL
ncbi:flagellar hook-associated protein FlgK [Lysinibacillus sp. BW-2-10]|uniref:flagellar hook-associated protein FlgK n=1 Tax=Lysinibacillus sp. BW-2-10 TaxID=2590030 RepID=UPI00117C4F8F|nr:flagellar hook-associated protein FlgK [Lysinibacillus sp. BW-2-10]TSI07330.1 flagellar hook-associated protein FlgK [Lysinibacillus sp. BW-2-10]